jgi:hypothetical protein
MDTDIFFRLDLVHFSIHALSGEHVSENPDTVSGPVDVPSSPALGPQPFDSVAQPHQAAVRPGYYWSLVF